MLTILGLVIGGIIALTVVIKGGEWILEYDYQQLKNKIEKGK